ncbi:hypothetical protein GCM10022234_00490 [Aeromicrobium panaciterrae]|uniref:hypothetical protein n=1 Tax=Aeromicrobium panaciterrae TaxID=363861 RepID=UPI0031E04085
MSSFDRRVGVLREALKEIRAESTTHPELADVEDVARRLHPHLYDGTFAANLGKLALFTSEQAETSAARKREEHELEVEQVLLYFLNPKDV